MSNWDQDYNEGDLTAYQRAEIQAQEELRRAQQRNARDSHLTVPMKTREDLLEQFQYHHTIPNDSYVWEDWRGGSDTWGANKLWQVCHNCGWIQFKNTPRETNKCGRCKSRSAVIVTAADISSCILNQQAISQHSIGVQLWEVYEDRRQRLREQRRAARNAME